MRGSENNFSSFDMDYFVRRLNESLPKDDDPIALGQSEPPREPFWKNVAYRLGDREIGVIGRHRLMRQYEIPQVHPLNMEGIIGYIQLEAGDLGRGDEPEGKYESLVLRVSSPIELGNGLVVPQCRISFLHEFEGFSEPYSERSDEVRRLGLFWKKTNLERFLPTEWFLVKPKEEYSTKRSKVGSK